MRSSPLLLNDIGATLGALSSTFWVTYRNCGDCKRELHVNGAAAARGTQNTDRTGLIRVVFKAY